MRAAWKSTIVFLTIFMVLVSISACREMETSASHEEIIRQDLEEIIELQGSSCGDVKHYSLTDHLDYRVECESGVVYRVHVSQEGHIKVNPHED